MDRAARALIHKDARGVVTRGGVCGGAVYVNRAA